MILQMRAGTQETPSPGRVPISTLVRYRQTWGVVLARSGSVATVTGLAGMVTGFVAIAATYTIGAVTDRYSFEPILMGASAAPALAIVAVFALVRNTRHTGNGILLRI
jgi:hypothetical protein